MSRSVTKVSFISQFKFVFKLANIEDIQPSKLLYELQSKGESSSFFNLIFFLVLEIKTMLSKRCYPAQSKMKREVFIGLCHFFKMKIPESETY